jgi:hypothetical protein
VLCADCALRCLTVSLVLTVPQLTVPLVLLISVRKADCALS